MYTGIRNLKNSLLVCRLMKCILPPLDYVIFIDPLNVPQCLKVLYVICKKNVPLLTVGTGVAPEMGEWGGA